MQRVKDLWFPFLLVAIPAVLFSLLLPYFPIDETRYLGVAWEMKLHNSFIVPLQNALPYSHKPPFLFWLLNLNWLVLGVNELSLRSIPLVFSLFNIFLVHRIALLLWNDAKTARYAAVILASTVSYLLWSVVIMFDVVLTFWVLLAVEELISAAKEHRVRHWVIAGLAMGGGLLTKGPVVFVYILPVALLSFVWIPRESFSKKWYAWLGLSLLIGIAVILAWLIPAALTGGETYRKAILWGQTVNRMANAFAHKRPFWWYLPWLPLLLVPWIFFAPSWRGSSPATDRGSRLVVLWIASSVLIFSCISSKQVHYMIPVLPALSLLIAKNLASCKDGEKAGGWRYAVGGFYAVAGIAALVLSYLKAGKIVQQSGVWGPRALGIGLILTAIAALVIKRPTVSRVVDRTALTSLAVCVVVLIAGKSLFDRYDLHDISREVKSKQEQGYTVLHYGKYHGQYHFIGRLSQPLVALDTVQEIDRYAATHDKIALISYEPQTASISKDDFFFEQPFRSKQVVLWNRKGIADFVKLQIDRNSASSRSGGPAGNEDKGE